MVVAELVLVVVVNHKLMCELIWNTTLFLTVVFGCSMKQTVAFVIMECFPVDFEPKSNGVKTTSDQVLRVKVN